MTRPYLFAGLIGLAMGAVALYLSSLGDRVLPLEFARSTAHVALIFEEAGPDAVGQARQAVRVDFLFIALYGAFLVTFAAKAARRGTPMLWAGAALGLVAAVADIFENRALLDVLAGMESGAAGVLWRLHLATWAKWGALAVYLVLFVPFFWRRGTKARGISMLAGASGLLALAAFLVDPAPETASFWLVEAFVLSIFLGLGLFVLFALFWKAPA